MPIAGGGVVALTCTDAAGRTRAAEEAAAREFTADSFINTDAAAERNNTPQASMTSPEASATSATPTCNDVAAAAAETAPASDAAETAAAAAAETADAPKGSSNACETNDLYVGQDCFFLELPDGSLACVAGLENLLPTSSPPGGADDTEGNAEAAAEEQILLARLQCHNCLQLLEFDSRAYFVQCSSCLTLNAVPNQSSSLRGGRAMIVICGRCSTRNISCLGSIYVECWQCHTVCQVDYPTPAAAAGLANGPRGSSAAVNAAPAAAATAAAGDPMSPTAQLDHTGRSGAAGLFGSSDSRLGVRLLQRRVQGGLRQSDEEESSVSTTGARGRNTRLSTAVELPPGLSTRGHGGRSLLARHSFNPLPSRNLRLHVAGAAGATSSSGGSSSSCRREGASLSDAGASLAQRSPQFRPLQQRWIQRRQQRQQRPQPQHPPSQRCARGRTAPAVIQTERGSPSSEEAGTNSSSKLLSLLYLLPFHGKNNLLQRRAMTTAAALTEDFKNSTEGRDRGAPSEEVQRGMKSRRARRHGGGRRGPVAVYSDQSVSGGLEREELDGAGEDVSAAPSAASNLERNAGRLTRRGNSVRGTQEMGHSLDEATEINEECAGVVHAEACLGRGEVEASPEGEHGRICRMSRQVQRRCCTTENEDSDSPRTPKERRTDPFVPFNSNTVGATRRGAQSVVDTASSHVDTHEVTRDTTSSSASSLHPAGGASASEGGNASAGGGIDTSTGPSLESTSFLSASSRAAAIAPARETAAACSTSVRRSWLPFVGTSTHARSVAQIDAAALPTATSLSNDDTRTGTPTQAVSPAVDRPSVHRKSWRDTIRNWRPQERRESGLPAHYNIGRNVP